MTPEEELAGFIAKFDPAAGELIQECRAELRTVFPHAVELVYDNYQFLAIGYASIEKVSAVAVSIAAGANGISLSFNYGTRLDDPTGILLGSGNQNRFVRLPDVGVLRQPDVRALIDEASSLTEPPFSDKPFRTVIKSISAKQRPRRKS
jgi:hypothetical protein